jgi:predicted dehydrogenase
MKKGLITSRRSFITGTAIAGIGFTVVPRYVLGGKGYIPPSDKINLAYVGVGTQGMLLLPGYLQAPEIRITALCDPQRKATSYLDWNTTHLLKSLCEALGEPTWKPSCANAIPAGLDAAEEYVKAYYSKHRNGEKSADFRTYADFREMFTKEKDIDAICSVTPDHIHGVISMAAIKRGIHITMHKPLSNRLEEGHKVVEAAKQSGSITHLIPRDFSGPVGQVKKWIEGGVIGELKEIHNWTHRPVWPQYPVKPAEKVAVPDGFNWDLWLGPEAERDYHPQYTNMVFRGWYDFGGGSMADMGYYSLMSVFEAFELKNPSIIEPNVCQVCAERDDKSVYKIQNDFSYPSASICRFRYPSNRWRATLDLVWYDGGMRPAIPEELYAMKKELGKEGMMFAGDKGIIIGDFKGQQPYVLSGDKKLAKELEIEERLNEATLYSPTNTFVQGIKTGQQVPGNCREAWPICEAANLYGVALRANQTLFYDPDERKITNSGRANAYLSRDYRPGWGLNEV